MSEKETRNNGKEDSAEKNDDCIKPLQGELKLNIKSLRGKFKSLNPITPIDFPIGAEDGIDLDELRSQAKIEKVKDNFEADFAGKLGSFLKSDEDLKVKIYNLISADEKKIINSNKLENTNKKELNTFWKFIKDKGEEYNENKTVHEPKHTLRLFNEFSRKLDTKYTVHDWDKSERNFEYDQWLSEAKGDFFNLIKEDNFYPSRLSALKLFYFLFGGDKWGFKKINFSWSSKIVRDWCLENPNTYPIRCNTGIDEFSQLLDVRNQLRREIRFLSEDKHLLKHLRNLKKIFGWEDENRVELDRKTLSGLSFFTDVDKVSSGLNAIFQPIKKFGTRKGVEIRAVEEIGSIQLIVEHLDSSIHVSKITQSLTVGSLGGDWQKAKNNFLGQCDWTMEADFSDGIKRRFNYLSSVEFNIENIKSDFEGVRHILTFYTT